MTYITSGAEKKNGTILLRDEIEKIIKEEQIDRNRFHEFSKSNYGDILKKFYYSFTDYSRFATTEITFSRKRLHIRSSLDCFAIAGIYTADSWMEYINVIKSALPVKANEKIFLILAVGFVYEGYTDEMFQVLHKMDEWIGDFFIVSSQFDWFITHDYIDGCTFMYQK